MEFHPILQKQINKYLTLNSSQNEEVIALLKVINASYYSFERDKKITEHAFEVSEKEYQEVLGNLKSENELKKNSIQKVKNALRNLDEKYSKSIDESEDILEVIDFLETQISIKNELSSNLVKAKDDAEKAVKAKSEFLSVISHEIRTPLNAIIGNIHILKEEPHLPSQNEFIDTLQISALNLLNLVNDILDFSKIEDGKVTFAEKPIYLHDLIEEIKATNRFKAEEKENNIQIYIDPKVPTIVLGDSTRLIQVINNLVSNSIKFTSKGNIEIKLDLISKTTEFSKIKFRIIDNGIGIKPENLAKIFERFTQADSNITREHGGSGLGLTIIRKLLHLQESEIYAESIFGKGSNFFFTLKLKNNKTDLNNKIIETLVSNKSLIDVTVLLVEDVKFNVLVAKKIMEKWGMKIETAENGMVALQKINTLHFDIILMDLQMPIMDGITATKAIRKMGIDIPIVALTASVSNETQTEVMDAGMNDYITKPFNPNDLFRVFVRLLS